MLKLILVIILLATSLVVTSQPGGPRNPAAPAPNQELQTITLDKLNAGLQNSVKSINNVQTQMNKVQSSVQILEKKINSQCNQNVQKLSEDYRNWVLVFTPVLLFIMLMGLVLFVARALGLKKALSENELPKRTIKNPEYDATTISSIGSNIQNLAILFPPTIKVTESWPSPDDLLAISKTKENLSTQAFKTYTVAESNFKNAAYHEKIVRELSEKNRTANTQGRLSEAVVQLKLMEERKDEAEKAMKKAKEEELDALKAIEKKLRWLEEGSKDNYQTTFVTKTSISRVIAFITILTIIFFIACISCFFIYHYIRTSCPPNLSSLNGVLVALCLGFAPYVANKIATTTSNRE